MTRLERSTRETTIKLAVDRKGGEVSVRTDDRFLTHMLETLARYAGLGLTVEATGDLRHHLVEDVAIALGLALKKETPETATRYGWALTPMDEALAQAAVDVGGRPYYVGPLPSRLYEHFLQSLSVNLAATVHIRIIRGKDKHHMVEAAVKAFGMALRQALAEGDVVFSTKGSVSLEWGNDLVLKSRIIVCLDVDHGRVVKGTNFKGLRDVGDPVELARRYEEEGADEIVFLDISASAEGRGTLLETVRRTAEVLFIPLTVGGGVRSVEDMGELLRAGADKISVNSAAVRDPGLLTRGASRFGNQCVVGSVDAKRKGNAWEAYVHGGRKPTGLDGVSWAREMARLGAGEVLLTSMDRDGVRTGYDLDLTRRVSDAVRVPVVASGGAGDSSHIRDAFSEGGASAALLAGILHDGLTTVGRIKDDLRRYGVDVR